MVSERTQHRVVNIAVLCLAVLGLLGILTTYVIIGKYHRAGDCRRDAVLASAQDTGRMLDAILDARATPDARRAAVEQWRADQNATERRIRACG